MNQTFRNISVRVGVVVVVAACSVDDRELALAPTFVVTPGAGGNPGGPAQLGGNASTKTGGGGSTAQGGSPISSAGGVPGGVNAGGTGGASGGSGSVCPDLNANGTSDCDETLIANPGFKGDLMGWLEDRDIEQLWDPMDGTGNRDSGADAVTFTLTSPSTQGSVEQTVYQCLPAAPGVKYEAKAQFFLPSGQGAGLAGVVLQLYGEMDCTGALLGAKRDLHEEVDKWSVAGTEAIAPAGTKSVALRLMVQKTWAAPKFLAYFDNVLFVDK